MSHRIFDDDFQSLCDTLENLLQGSEVDARFLEDELDQRIDDLKKLLDVPPKNDAARNTLKSCATPELQPCFPHDALERY